MNAAAGAVDRGRSTGAWCWSSARTAGLGDAASARVRAGAKLCCSRAPGAEAQPPARRHRRRRRRFDLYPLDLEGASPDDYARWPSASARNSAASTGAALRGEFPRADAAGADRSGPIRARVHVNLTARWWLTQACLPLLGAAPDAAVVFALDAQAPGTRVLGRVWPRAGAAWGGAGRRCRPNWGPDRRWIGSTRADAQTAARQRLRRRTRPLAADPARHRPDFAWNCCRRPARDRGGMVADAVTVASAALLLFLIPIRSGTSGVPVAVAPVARARRRRIVLVRELLDRAGIADGVPVGRQAALDLMHLRQESVSIAGGIVLFLIGLRMIFPPPRA